MNISELKVKIFADGLYVGGVPAVAARYVSGATYNPTIMRKMGAANYLNFARTVARSFTWPISLEVLTDDNMEAEARVLSALGPNVYVKIPIVDSQGRSTLPIIERLSGEGIKVNVTAVMTSQQIANAAAALGTKTPGYISIFAGRIADTGRDPAPLFQRARELCSENIETIWASTREIYNIVQADEAGADIITVPADMLPKLEHIGRDLDELSAATAAQFASDAKAAGYVIPT